MIEISKYTQTNQIGSEVEAEIAVVIPILKGILYSLKRDIVEQVGGYEKVTLSLLPRLYREGDGDCGICFEYAIHEAIVDNNPLILERIETALTKFCKIKGGIPTSILFGVEKSGAMQLIDSVKDHLTDDSLLMTGSIGQPIKLKKHIQGVVNAFRKESDRAKLPNSINGLWKADLFVGMAQPDKWVGTTVKVKRKDIEGARGLRLALTPSTQGKPDKIEKIETKNIIVCPVPYDNSFVELFYQSWLTVKHFLGADAHVPPERMLPHSDDRFVCKQLEQRRDFSVLDVIESFEIMKQKYLMEERQDSISLLEMKEGKETALQNLAAPIALLNGN